MTDAAALRTRRRRTIAELIRSGAASSQEQIAERLAAAGLPATQATVSRDLEELGAYKVRRGGYALPERSPDAPVPQDRLRRVLAEWVVRVEAAGPLVVVKTSPGSAHLVAVALDAGGDEAVAGTVAGDDTVFVAVRTAGAPEGVADRLRGLAGLGPT